MKTTEAGAFRLMIGIKSTTRQRRVAHGENEFLSSRMMAPQLNSVNFAAKLRSVRAAETQSILFRH